MSAMAGRRSLGHKLGLWAACISAATLAIAMSLEVIPAGAASSGSESDVAVPAAGASVPGGRVPDADVGASLGGPAPMAPRLPLKAAAVRESVSGGDVLTFGGAPALGSLVGRQLAAPVVGMASTPGAKGYWLAAADGGVFTYGDAGFFGSAGDVHLDQPVVGIAATPDGNGYWLAASDGGVFTYGDAGFFGSAGDVHLDQPVVGIAATPDGNGYWLVASDGGVFTFGDAGFFGSAGDVHLNQPIVGIAATPDGDGYWLVASDGGVFTYGDAGFFGSAGDVHLDQPVVGIAATPDGDGYWLVASDGGVFTYGDAGFFGSAAGTALAQPVIGAVSDPLGGYWLYEGEREPPLAEVFSAGLVSALNQRSGIISAAVLDLNSGHLYQYRPGQGAITASIVKVEILGTLLVEAQSAGRWLTANEKSVATSMIEYSDNNAATDLWNEVGGAPAVRSFDRSIGMNATSPSADWGLTVTTAADQVILLQHLIEPNGVLSTASRATCSA